MVERAHPVLDQAPRPDGHGREPTTPVPGSVNVARPSIATHDGVRLVAWVEWLPARGDVVRAVLDTGDDDPEDPEPVSDTGHPSSNQEAVAHADGTLEVCWQGRQGDRFAIFSRRWTAAGGWQSTCTVSLGIEANVWDPTVTAFADGGTAYGWSEHVAGSYRVVVRRRSADGEWGEPQQLTSGSDYALHPRLAVTGDQQLWCAFDLITVSGHGGSGPTKLRPAAEVGADPAVVEGVRLVDGEMAWSSPIWVTPGART